MMALLGVLMSMMLTEWGFGVVPAVLAIIGVAMVLTLMHGLLITRLNMQPFIVTLCGLLFYRGLARFITNDETKGFGTVAGLDFLRYLANGNLFGVPMPFVLLILISVIAWIVLHRSVYGRYLFATGRNEEAARYAGINTNRIITAAYVIAGALTAISGIIFAFYTNSVSPANHGNAYELYGIAAAVLGGCSLRGGEGSIIGILIGTALLQVLRNLVNLLGIPSSLDFAVMGAVILIGVMADQIFTERRNRRQVALMRESMKHQTG
jgi:ribose transport system permease protein